MVQVAVEASVRSPELSTAFDSLGIVMTEQSPWHLSQSPDGNWVLSDDKKRKLEIDFDQNKQDYHRLHKGSGELIARALGIKENIKKTVDLTSGLGIDAVLLAQIGFEVVSIERNPILHFLLAEAQKKSKRREIQNISFVHGDARLFLTEYKITEPTSCYYDPMYPEKKKSALPRQEMVIFRELVGSDEDSLSTLQLAVRKGFTRTAVKRPVKAEVILEGPDFQLTSKLVRFDIYYPRLQGRVEK